MINRDYLQMETEDRQLIDSFSIRGLEAAFALHDIYTETTGTIELTRYRQLQNYAGHTIGRGKIGEISPIISYPSLLLLESCSPYEQPPESEDISAYC